MTTDFQAFNLHPELMQAITDMDYQSPTPIQTSAIPELMAGFDVLGQAQTGTGKTAAFALPMLHALEQGLIQSTGSRCHPDTRTRNSGCQSN